MSARWRNPLRRTSDRIQACSATLAIMTVLLVTPWVAWYTARETYRDGVGEMQHRFHVPAVLLEDSPPATGGTADDGPRPTVPARASWGGPDGAPRTGTIAADPDQRAGSTQMIWVDDHGVPASPPARRHPTFHAFMAAVLAAGGLAGALTCLHRGVVWWLDRRRVREWQAQWLIVEPQWRRR